MESGATAAGSKGSVTVPPLRTINVALPGFPRKKSGPAFSVPPFTSITPDNPCPTPTSSIPETNTVPPLLIVRRPSDTESPTTATSPASHVGDEKGLLPPTAPERVIWALPRWGNPATRSGSATQHLATDRILENTRRPLVLGGTGSRVGVTVSLHRALDGLVIRLQRRCPTPPLKTTLLNRRGLLISLRRPSTGT